MSPDTDVIRARRTAIGKEATDRLCDEVDRLRAENVALAVALNDIAAMRQVPSGLWLADAECASENKRCHHRYPDDPDEWCPVCVAEVAWCAWKMGVLA